MEGREVERRKPQRQRSPWFPDGNDALKLLLPASRRLTCQPVTVSKAGAHLGHSLFLRNPAKLRAWTQAHHKTSNLQACCVAACYD